MNRKPLSLIASLLLLTLCGILPVSAYDVITINGPKGSAPIKAVVAVPEGKAPAGGWSTLYFLNGYTGSHLDWTRHLDLDREANLYKMILVMPDGGNSWYFDRPGSMIETTIADSLTQLVRRSYPSATTASRNVISGLSMGGHGALRLAARHPDKFGSVAALSGAVDIAGNSLAHKSFGLPAILGPYQSNSKKWREASAIYYADTLAKNHTNVWLTCGTADFFYKDNLNFAKGLRTAGADVSTTWVPRASHDWAFWTSQWQPMMKFAVSKTNN